MPSAGVALLTAAFAAICAAFVIRPALATFADDSVTYLVMAQVFSPWQEAAAPVAEAYAREGFYPPLFPLVLALSGTAHDISRAHAATAFILAACLPVLYGFSRNLLANRWGALAVAAIMALLPALWINAKAIVSEPLYCLALLALLWAAEDGRGRPWLLAVLLAALVLTRTAGFALVGGYALWALTQPDRWKRVLPAVAPFAAYGIWLLLRPAGTADANVAFLAEHGWKPDFARQAQSITEAWIGSLLIYWVDDRPVRTALAAAAGVLSLLGLALRLRANKPDGWIMAAYLLTFVAWPFYDQMGRFVFPAIPVLVAYAFHAAGAFFRRKAMAYAVTAVLYASLAAPALAFLYQRYTAPAPYPALVDWYRYPDWREAQRRADVQLGLAQDMGTIAEKTPAGARVMWVAPAYVALLAGRSSIRTPSARLSPEEYRSAVVASGADYLLLTAYHPRDTLSDESWRAGMRAMSGRFEATSVRRQGDAPASVLLRVK